MNHILIICNTLQKKYYNNNENINYNTFNECVAQFCSFDSRICQQLIHIDNADNAANTEKLILFFIRKMNVCKQMLKLCEN